MATDDPNTPKDSTEEARIPTAIPPMLEETDLNVGEHADDALVDFSDVAPLTDGASGVIPLAELPEPASGQSLTSWTEIIRRQRETAPADAEGNYIPEATPVEVDAPSDAHLLKMVGNTDSSVLYGQGESDVLSDLPLPETSEIPQADLPVFGEEPSDSAADLACFLPPLPLGLAGSSAVQFDVTTPPADAGGAMPLPDLRGLANADEGVIFETAEALDANSAVALGDPTPTPAPEFGASDVDLGRHLPDIVTDTGRSSILDALLADNVGDDPSQHQMPSLPEMELGDPDFPEPMGPSRLANLPPPAFVPPKAPTMPSFDLPDHTGGARPGSGWSFDIPGHESGRLAAAAAAGDDDRDSDDSVDLYAGAAPTPSITDSGSLSISDIVIEESQRRSQLLESSAVDLGSRPSFHESDFDAAFQQHMLSVGAPSSRAMPQPQTPRSDGEVNLGLPVDTNDTNSSMIRNNAAENASLANVFEERRQSKRQEVAAAPKVAPAFAADVREEGPTQAESERRAKRGSGWLIGTAAGLLVGAGGVFGLHMANVLPNKGTPAPAGDNSTEVAQAKQDAATARATAEDAKTQAEAFKTGISKALTDAGVNADNIDDAIKSLASAKTTSAATITMLTESANKAKADAMDAQKALETAKTQLADATKAVTTAKAEATDAMKALETAKAEAEAAKKSATDAKKAAEDSLAALTKALKDAGADAPKLEDGVKKLVEARALAEMKEKDALTKAEAATKKEAEAMAKADAAAKKEADLQKVVEVAQKAEATAKAEAEAAKKAALANETTLKTLSDRLAQAKFVAANPNAEALLKGIDDIIKVAGTDATASLRDDLVKARDRETKLKTDLAAAQAKEADTVKMVTTLKADAAKLQTELAGLNQKHAAETNQLKADAAKMAKDLAEVATKIEAANKNALSAKADADKAAVELAKAKTENDRLARELDAVKDLANMIKNSGGPSATVAKLDPQRLGERAFNEALTAFHAGKYDDAEKGFTKAIQLHALDARYHYLLGITHWVRGQRKEADEAFTRGQQLELTGRPPRKSIADVLEGIQGAPRQALNAYRP